ncbi:Solute carrier family 2, facilitated glucose transporter member 3 [Trichinella britovi]|uniref:Solute carrier family 2, facilitated glucose transporter member 3 n=1 Tax=Trichinella britovi TaxID=45882 RepID=A0A0V1CDC4_TRIBR|nr:Solute carrier family 2, facilitated glucose transporter member 3 [Trichinella britovi]
MFIICYFVRLALLRESWKKNMRNEETNEPNEQIPLTTDGSTSKVAEKAVPAIDDSALQGKLTRRLLFAVCASALGSSFVFGYNIGVMNSPELIIKKWMNETVSNTGASWTSSQIDAMWAMIVSMFPLGGLLGGMLSGIVSDRLGRRNGMLMNNIFAILAAGLFLTAKYASHYMLLLFGRMIVGINAGLSSALCPMYLTEISPVNLRGMLGSVNQLVVTISILVSQVLGISEILGRDDTWHILLFLTIVPAIFQLITLPHCPESPKYLLILKKRREDAEKALKLLREKDNVDAEIFALEEEAKQNSAAPKVRFSDMFKDKVLRWALFIAVMMMLSQQFSGINAVMFYSTRIFIDGADLTPDSARYATMGVGAINVIMTLVSTAIIDKAGRRTLHLLGLGGMWISCVTLTVSMILLKQGYNWSSYLCIAFVLIFVISFATGPGSIPWFFVSELFLQNARGHATSVAVPVNWGSAFIIGWIFPPMVRAIGEYSFLVFTGFLTIFWLFTFKYVPETKNRPVDDIVAELRRAVGVTQEKHEWDSSLRYCSKLCCQNFFMVKTMTPEDVCGALDVTVMHDDYESDSESIDTLPVEKTLTCFSSDLGEEKQLALHETASELISLSPTGLFHKILPVEKIEDFADKSQRYALQKGVNFEVHVEVLMQFFGLILLSGYHSVPNENHFWSTADDVCVSIVPRVMSRNKFKNVKRYFHLIKPHYDYLNQKLLHFGVIQEKLSIDESMVPYYGHPSSKMFIRVKTIRFGQKIWAMTSTSGYPFKLELYSGVAEKTREPLGTKVIKRMISALPDPKKHQVYFHNFFASKELLTTLGEMKHRSNRYSSKYKNKSNSADGKNKVTKKQRGFFDYKNDGNVYVCRWNDSSVVTLASNHLTHLPVGQTKRYSKKQKKRIEIPMPNIVKNYNESMSGVHTMDMLLSSYRPKMRSRKWWWNLFNNTLNIAVVATWQLHCELHDADRSAMTHLAFRRDITAHLLRARPLQISRPGPRSYLPHSLRSSRGHFLQSSTQGLCAVCKKNCRNQCLQCGNGCIRYVSQLNELFNDECLNEYLKRKIIAHFTSPQNEFLHYFHDDQLTCWLAFSIFAATFGCSFIFGYNIAVINTPQVIQQWINETLIEKNQTWTQSEMDSVWALIVGIFPFGGFIGGMLSGLVADKVGRRNGMLLNNIFAILAVSVMSVTQYTTSYICLIVGRFVIGINCGISSALCPMYLTEISPIKLRGMLDIIAIPAIFQLCSLPFCPESPKYLIAHGSNMEKVQKDLQKLRQVENVNSEIEAIQYEMNAVTATPKLKFPVGLQVLFLDMFRDRILRWALFISIMMMLSQQLSGINAVLFYSTKIFMDGAGLSEANAQFATLGVGLINVLMTIVSAILIDKAGRRMLQLIGLGGMWISCIALSSIPWFYTNEIFLQNARGYANAIAASANWMSSFLVGWIFPLMANALEEYTFLVFVGTLAVFWLFTYKFVPETKNQKIEDVVAALKIPF